MVQILGSPETQRTAVAVNEIAILALGLVGVFDDRLPRLALFVLSRLRLWHFRFSRARFLDDDPGVDREDAAPSHGAGGEDSDHGVRLRGSRRQ